MTRAFAEREAPPVSHDAPCTVCGAEGGPICDDCATICARAAEHTVECRCTDCRIYARAVAAGEVSL